jgi:hypothetical protein
MNHVARLLLGHSQSLSLLAHGAVALKGIKVGRRAVCMACLRSAPVCSRWVASCITCALHRHSKVMAAGKTQSPHNEGSKACMLRSKEQLCGRKPSCHTSNMQERSLRSTDGAHTPCNAFQCCPTHVCHACVLFAGGVRGPAAGAVS